MKEMNLPETSLRSWQPRRPSARLKRRIFSTRLAATWLVGWLAPVTACAVLTILIFNPGTSFPGNPAGARPMLAMMMSNQTCATYVSDGFQNEQNHLSTVTFDWTNRSGFTSSICFTPSAKSSNPRQ